MALEAVVFPQDLFTHTCKRLHPMAGGQWIYELGELEDSGNALLASGFEAAGTDGLGSCHGSATTVAQEPRWGLFDGVRGLWDPSRSSPMAQSFLQQDDDMAYSSSPEEAPARDGVASPGTAPASAVRCRKKRRRAKSCKNEAEVENQRMTHIAVERNRRKLMNEYLVALRSLMPAFYVQRGDQASIVGGAINFVKELEHLLQSLEAQKRMKQQQQQRQQLQTDDATASAGCGVVLAGVSTATAAAANHNRSSPAAADVDVTIVDSHANLKVLSRRRPRQLLRMVTGLQGLRLTTLHLNVTTIDQMVRYSFSLKVEDDCQLSSVEEIAAAVHQLLGMIQEETDS